MLIKNGNIMAIARNLPKDAYPSNTAIALMDKIMGKHDWLMEKAVIDICEFNVRFIS